MLQKIAEKIEARQSDSYVRRWGVEIEHPDVSLFSNGQLERWARVYDNSVRQNDCECECEACVHDCNCNQCEITNGWGSEDHCEDCTANEASSPVMLKQRFSDWERRELAELQERFEMEDHHLWGGHIHVEARDLTIPQIGAVQKVYLRVYDILGERLTGRDFIVQFAEDYRNMNERERFAERMLAVNVTNVVRWLGWNDTPVTIGEHPDYPEFQDTNPTGPMSSRDERKSTIEFRHFQSIADPDIIEARASICRAIVDYVASGSALYWLLRCETKEQLFDLLQPELH